MLSFCAASAEKKPRIPLRPTAHFQPAASFPPTPITFADGKWLRLPAIVAGESRQRGEPKAGPNWTRKTFAQSSKLL